MPDYKYNINNSSKKEELDVLYTPSLFIRFVNYIIDTIAVAIVSFLILKLTGSDHVDGITYDKLLENGGANPGFHYLQYLIIGVSFFYYTIAEYSTGKTIGKFFTKTKVVDIYGDRPSIWPIMLRTVVRLIPLAAIVIFFTNNRTLHDILSKTYVIVDE